MAGNLKYKLNDFSNRVQMSYLRPYKALAKTRRDRDRDLRSSAY